MDTITERTDSLVGSFVIFNGWGLQFTIFCLTLLFVFGTRILFLFPRQHTWITYVIRVVGGAVPVTVFLFVIAAVYSRSGSISNVAFFQVSNIVFAILGLVAGGVLAYFAGRYFEPFVVEILNKQTRISGLKDTLTDIRHMRKELPGTVPIQFEKQFTTAELKNEMFLGIDIAGSPVTLERSTWKNSHVQIMGPPGTGKGIQAAVTLTQSLKYGDAVFVFDPKNDEWAPSVFHEACRSAGVQFQFVDLSEPIPQLNPLLNSSPDEVAEMLYAGLELSRRGSDSDFYRLDDRKAARFAASLLEKESLSLTEMGNKAKFLIDRDLSKGAKAFFTAIEEVGEQICIQTRTGVDLSVPLRDGGCIYIVGSMRNDPIVILQKMLFVRIIQIIERTRNRNRHCSIFLDEFKYLLSATSVNALGAIRDKGCNILLAHQSLGDFANCGSDLSEDGVRTTILDTTPIKWLYRPSDKDTASWISNQTGRILVSTQRSNTVRNLELSESLSASRSVGETERNLYDVNTIMSLPKGCAVCLGTDLPQLAMATALPVQKLKIYPESAKLAIGESIDLLERIPKSANSEIHDESKHMPLFDRIPKDRLFYFLYEETWTHIDIIFQLLNDVSNEQIEEILKEQSEAKLIRNHQFPTGFSSTEQIWGIARRGVSLIQETDGDIESRPVFYKSSVNRTSMNHQLDIQRLRLIAERKGWRSWKKGARNSVKKKGEIYPDAVAVRPDHSRIAIEVERTIKTNDRYPGILVAHLIARKNRKWDEIYYFSPDAKVSQQLKRIFSEISEANHLGEVLEINDAHRAPFRFLTYDDDWT